MWLKSGMKRDGIVAAEGSSSDGNDADGGVGNDDAVLTSRSG